MTGMILLVAPTKCHRVFVVIEATDDSVAAVKTNDDLSFGIDNRGIGNNAVGQATNLGQRDMSSLFVDAHEMKWCC